MTTWRNAASSDASPVSDAVRTNSAASSPVRIRLTEVPAIAAAVILPIPCVSSMVTVKIANEATIAVATGLAPARTRGTRN